MHGPAEKLCTCAIGGEMLSVVYDAANFGNSMGGRGYENVFYRMEEVVYLPKFNIQCAISTRSL